MFHMDGARISNAAVALGCGFKEFTADAGIDVLSFGGTKNGIRRKEFHQARVFEHERQGSSRLKPYR